MKVKEMIEFLSEFEPNREVVIHNWNAQEGSKFFALNSACTPKANSKNMVVLIGNGLVKQIPKTEEVSDDG